MNLVAIRRELDEAGSDVARLTHLMEALKGRHDEESTALQMTVAMRLGRAKRAAGIDDRDMLTRFLFRRSLTRAAEQPLHRYRTDETEFEELRAHLVAAHKLGRLDEPSLRDGAVFVLFGAEWFRRSFSGGVTNWRSLTDAVGLIPRTTAVALTALGLRWWRRPVRKMNGDNEWLHTLRLEGGFPSRLLDTQERGWITSHLRRLIAATATTSAEFARDDVVALAVLDEAVPRTFRTPDFAALCAELAVDIVSLRREHGAAATATGLRLSAWLDANDPSWRAALSIEGEGASRLLDDLVSDSLQKLAGEGARCRRMLVRTTTGWHPSLRLGLEGELTSTRELKGVASRLHVFPAGPLADTLSGALAVLEPSDDGGPWLARPRVGAPRGPIVGYPFAAPASVELRTEGRTVATVTWPGGDPVRSEVLTFLSEDEDREETGRLVLFATGSCRNRKPILYVSAPSDFAASVATGEAVDPVWRGDGRQVIRVSETVHVGLASSSVFYRVEPGASSDEADKLVIRGTEVRGVTTTDGDPIYAGVPDIRKQANSVVAQGHDDLVWRRVGERDWRDLRRSPVTPGLVEIVWRDPASRAARDRRRVAIMPQATEIDAQPLPGGGARFDLAGAPGWLALSTTTATARLAATEPTAAGCRWQMTWEGPETRLVGFRLALPGDGAVDVTMPFPMRTGRFLRPDGTSFPDNVPITLDRLKGGRAVAGGTAVLWIETHGPGRQGVHRLRFDGELALWSLRDVVSALLAEAGDIDSEAWIGFAPAGFRLRVKKHEIELSPVRDGLRLPALPTALGDQPVALRWRSMVDMGPSGSREIATIPAGSAGEGGVVALPEGLAGPGVAYLRAGDLTVSRPILVSRPYPDPAGLSPLRRAVLIGDRREREDAFDAALWGLTAATADGEADLAWLHAHLAIPEALPPSTFQAFNVLAHHSRALAAFVASAPDDSARDRAWGLERELPLLWTLVGVEDWRAAFTAKRDRLQEQLKAMFPREQAMRLATEAAENAAERFVSFDETLRVSLWLAGFVKPPTKLQQSGKLVAQDFIRRLSDGPEAGSSSSCFHTAAIAPHLGPLCPWIHDFDQSHHEALEAPMVAALQAGGRLSALDGPARLRIREAMIQDQQHFADAYAAALIRTGRQE